MTDLQTLIGSVGFKKESGASGGEWAGPCPSCGGKDRFRVWPEHPSGSTGGRYLCRGCGRKGDDVQYLRDFHGMGFREACAALQITPKDRPAPSAIREKTAWEPKATALPGDAWCKAAKTFVEPCATNMTEGSPGLAYALSRGLALSTIEALEIGWNPADLYQDREAWGLPPEVNPDTGRPRKVWLPAGLAIPTWGGGVCEAIKIRRAAWSEGDKWPKYVAVTGSAQAPMMLVSWQGWIPGEIEPAPAFLVVESELDAILAKQEAGSLISCLALRTAAGKPDLEAHSWLQAAPAILVALDFDRAGASGWPWWKEHFPQAALWPVPTGKDVGDMHKAGASIREWIAAGLAHVRAMSKGSGK